MIARPNPACLVLFLGLRWLVVQAGAANLIPADSRPARNTAITDIFSADSFVPIPGGEFLMGNPPDPAVTPVDGGSRWTSEQPQHQVRLAAFELGKYEVTQRQWDALMERNPSYFKNPAQPVEQVSWNRAHEFITRLNALDPTNTYRLPTEAEWEYACRAGSADDTPAGLDSIAWYYSPATADEKPQPHPVGQKAPNAWGLCDLIGNVWEWCEDVWHPTYVNAHADGSAWLTNEPENERVLRGGSWLNRAEDCRPGRRWHAHVDFKNNFIGFRLVRRPRAKQP
jgi:formylglycine-generating enzyme required for sulfatase activity